MNEFKLVPEDYSTIVSHEIKEYIEDYYLSKEK